MFADTSIRQIVEKTRREQGVFRYDLRLPDGKDGINFAQGF